MTPAEREARFDMLTRIGCIVCRLFHRAYTPPVIHHLTGIKYRATGKKADDKDTIGLCPAHHDGAGYGISLHAGVEAWESKFGTQEYLLEVTNELIERLH